MTSSNRNVFCVTGPLRGESTGGFPSQRPVMLFLICAWTNGWANDRDADDLRRHRAYYDVTCVAESSVFLEKYSGYWCPGYANSHDIGTVVQTCSFLSSMWNDLHHSHHLGVDNIKENKWHFYVSRKTFVRKGSIICDVFFHIIHDDVIKWKHFPRNWPFVRGIHRSRWIPHTKASGAELWCFIWSASE